MITREEKETLVREVMQNYPEADYGMVLKCTDHECSRCRFSFTDSEEGKSYTLNLDKLVHGLNILIELALQGDYRNHAFPNGVMDAGNWDNIDVDALVQCAIFGVVVYE